MSWWSRLQCKHGPTAASPCMRCYFAYYLFSPAPVQAFECIVSVLINSLVFNVVEALPCMPGPCQLLNWQKVVEHGVVEKYVSYLLGENEPLPTDKYNPFDIEGGINTLESCSKCDCSSAVIPDALALPSLVNSPSRQEEEGDNLLAVTSSATSTCTSSCPSPVPTNTMENGGYILFI